MGQESKKVRINVNLFDIEGEKFVNKEFAITATNLTTVLDALIHIKETHDPELSFRYSCRMGICGSCAMVIDGKPRLACETLVTEMSSNLTVAPIMVQPTLKGLVTDFDDFFEKHKSVMPWLVRNDQKEKYDAKNLYPQTDIQRDTYLPFAECIKCGLCLDACPVENTNKDFVGPQALAQAYHYITDSRDQGKAVRLEKLDTLDGIWGCEFSGSCSKVCPKSVDPALAIQLLKSEVAKYRLSGSKK